jgi:nicotinate-nucleotide adenylyltransferase
LSTTRGGIGILGGTFDPPHVGHVTAAVQCLEQLELAEVLLVVAGDPWQKTSAGAVTAAHHRVAMTQHAAHGLRGVSVDDREVLRAGPSFTIDTVDQLVRDTGRRPILLLGADAAAGVRTWHRAEELVASVDVAIVGRTTGSVATTDSLIETTTVVEVAMPRMDVSSADIRSRLAVGRRVDGMVPAAVIDYIEMHGLYRDPECP